MRGLPLALLALLAGQAAAQEGGPIRSGEHDGFTRIVLQVDPRTEWSLETDVGEARVRFPGKPIDFSTAEVFERIPRTRVRAVTATTGARTSEIVLSLGCDCRVSARFVGARYLALDIADRGAASPPAEPLDAAALAASEAEAREAREATAVATAEELLLMQIERAAGQGLVQLALTPPATPAPEAGHAEAAHPAEPAPQSRPDGASEAHAHADVAEPAEPETLAALDDHDQIEAVTVYDRDDALVIGRRKPVPETCLPEGAFDVASWATLKPWAEQRAALRGHLVGEFDRPDAAAVRALARFYVRTGFGAEAVALLKGFPEVDGLSDRALLVDLARVVDGGMAAAGGPLALPHPCPGRHALWLALGGMAPAFHDEASFVAVEEAFGELPPDMRTALAPRLVGRMLDAARPVEARRLLDTSLRDGAGPSRALRLAEARTLAAEGEADRAVRAFAALSAGNDPTAREALVRVSRLALEVGIAVPDGVVTDLRTAALEQRGTPDEPLLRALLVEVLAARAELPEAVDEARAAAIDLPERAAEFDALAVAAMAAADPAKVRPAVYVETVLGAEAVIAAAPPDDPARREIAGRLVALGLPTPALRVVAPAVAAGDRGARLVGARARIALGEGEAARATLAGLNGPGSAALRAEAFALDGDYGRAFRLAARRGGDSAVYAWPAGAWDEVATASGAPRDRAALAGFTAGLGTASAEPTALPPELAVREPLPDLSRPSLDAARRLLATGPQVEGVVSGVLAGDD